MYLLLAVFNDRAMFKVLDNTDFCIRLSIDLLLLVPNSSLMFLLGTLEPPPPQYMNNYVILHGNPIFRVLRGQYLD